MSTKIMSKKISRFSELAAAGMQAWVDAGELLVEMVEEDDRTYASIVEAVPDMSYALLSRFEQIGRKQLHPRILMACSSGGRRLATLPYSEQVKYLDGPIDVVIEAAGEISTLQIMAKDLNTFQIKQVFDSGTIRGVDAQRAWLRSRERKTSLAGTDGAAYTVKGDSLIVNRPCKLSRKDLATLLAQMS